MFLKYLRISLQIALPSHIKLMIKLSGFFIYILIQTSSFEMCLFVIDAKIDFAKTWCKSRLEG